MATVWCLGLMITNIMFNNLIISIDDVVSNIKLISWFLIIIRVKHMACLSFNDGVKVLATSLTSNSIFIMGSNTSCTRLINFVYKFFLIQKQEIVQLPKVKISQQFFSFFFFSNFMTFLKFLIWWCFVLFIFWQKFSILFISQTHNIYN